jgi:thiol-disulfide isomerase/thioredoxin
MKRIALSLAPTLAISFAVACFGIACSASTEPTTVVGAGSATGVSSTTSSVPSTPPTMPSEDPVADAGVGSDAGGDPADTGVSPQPQNQTWTSAACPAPANAGVATGQQLKDIVLKDCDGNDYPLAKTCGADATWLAVLHAWCPHCKKIASFSEAVATSYAGKNLAAIQVVVESPDSKPPTQADCKAWRDGYGLKNIVTLYDPNPRQNTLKLFDTSSTSLTVYIDKNRVIKKKLYTDVKASITREIDAALK